MEGEKCGEFWVHSVARHSAPQIHLSMSKRPEVVLFGPAPALVPPFTILAGEFTLKADLECAADGLTRDDVIESIWSAQSLRVKNSTSPWRKGRRERIYVINSINFEGIPIYSKGVIRKIFISGKRSTASD